MINKMFIRVFAILSIAISTSALLCAETVGIFYDSSKAQIAFAAGDVKTELEAKGFTVEILHLSLLTTGYANKKVVIALDSNSTVTGILTNQGGTLPSLLGEQAYSLRTTTSPQTSYWVFGGDNNGAMYGGFQIAENIKFNGFAGTYSNQESPTILKRGIKLNLPLDKESPTYGKSNKGGFEGASYPNSIPHVWDSTFWYTWFDDMARNRYNVVSVWLCHPFTSLVKMPDYPDVAIQNITGFNGYFKTMTIDDKIVFWKKIMAYAHARGFEFYFFNWNVFTYGATDKYGITESAANPITVTYMYKSMIKLLETYPDLDGFGITNGENESNQDFLWETYGKGMYDYALANPNRKLRFIHRWHWTDIAAIKARFEPLFTLPNVTFDMSYKYSQAHMYAVATPTWWNSGNVTDLTTNGINTWFTVRNDDFYYHNWGDPDYARAYINGIPGKDSYFTGFYMGSDGFCPTRSFFSKNSVTQGIHEINRQWYMFMIWGRLSYNPNTSDNVFKNYMSLRYQDILSTDLFEAWKKASSGIPKVSEIITGDLNLDFHWWPEGCHSSGGFITIDRFISSDVGPGSLLCSVENSALNNCGGKKNTYQLADEIEADALYALSVVDSLTVVGNTDMGVTINNIKAMSYLSIYYAYKIRGATFKRANKTFDAAVNLGKAYCWWMNYANLMDTMYDGMTMHRVADFPNWHHQDANVLKEYNDNGGIGVPNCSNEPQAPYAFFEANKTYIAPGETVSFTDKSINTPTSWVWSFQGGTPGTSTVQNPTVSYANIGTYSVTLTAKNAIGSDTITRTGYITVSNNSTPIVALTEWVSGTTNNKVSGNKRLMIVMVMGESNGDFSAASVSYGGQAMTKQTEKLYFETSSRTYASIFTLNEAGVTAATNGTIAVTWSTAPSVGYSVYSVLAGNVDQTNPVITSATNGLSGTTITTSALSVAGGDMVVMCGATAQNNTVTFNNNFNKTFESSSTWGDGVGGTKLGSGTNEIPSFTQSAGGRMALCAIVIKNFYTSRLPQYTVTLSVNPAAGGTVTGAGTYTQGESITLAANAAAGYSFVNWTENNIEQSKNVSYTFTASRNRNLKANFANSLTLGEEGIDLYTVYPNPADDILFVDYKGIDIHKIMLVDIVGNVVYTDTDIVENETIDLSDFISGLYFVTIHTANTIYTKKLRIN